MTNKTFYHHRHHSTLRVGTRYPSSPFLICQVSLSGSKFIIKYICTALQDLLSQIRFSIHCTLINCTGCRCIDSTKQDVVRYIILDLHQIVLEHRGLCHLHSCSNPSDSSSRGGIWLKQINNSNNYLYTVGIFRQHLLQCSTIQNNYIISIHIALFITKHENWN